MLRFQSGRPGASVSSKILIIDDNESLAQNLRDVLEGARELDVEVTLAASGQGGLKAARRDGFDVAVVDVKLPDASGVDLIRPLRVGHYGAAALGWSSGLVRGRSYRAPRSRPAAWSTAMGC